MPSQQATTGPAPMEGVERTNAVVVRVQDRIWGFLSDGTLMQWRWTGGGIVTLVGVLGTWPITAGTGEEEGRWKGGGWFEGNIEPIGHLKEMENLEALH